MPIANPPKTVGANQRPLWYHPPIMNRALGHKCHYLFVGLLMVGCSAPQPPANQPPSAPPQELPILWQQAGSYGCLKVPVRLVARDPATLAQVPLADVPVDFDKQMVLIAALGIVPSDGYAIRITRVWRRGNRILTDVRVSPPPPARRPGPPNLTSPYHIVVVPRSDLNVEGFTTALPNHPRGYNPYK